MANETKKELGAKAVAWSQEFPKGTEVAVVADKGPRWVGIVAGEAKVLGTRGTGYRVEVDVFRGDSGVQVVHVADENGTHTGAVELEVPQGEPCIGCETSRIRKRAVEKRKKTSPQRVALTQEEKVAAGEQAADAYAMIEERQKDLKDIKKKIESEISEAESKISRSNDLLRKGYEVRPVSCTRILDFDRGTSTEVRDDTGEVVSEDQLTDKEKSMELSLFPELHKDPEPEPEPEKKPEPKKKADDKPHDVQEKPEAPPEGEDKGEEAEPVSDGELAGLVPAAVQILKETKRASVASIQRRLGVPLGQAVKVMEQLEADGIVSGPSGPQGKREILADLSDDAPPADVGVDNEDAQE